MAVKTHKRIRPTKEKQNKTKNKKPKTKKCEHKADRILTIEAEAPTPQLVILTKEDMESYKSKEGGLFSSTSALIQLASISLCK